MRRNFNSFRQFDQIFRRKIAPYGTREIFAKRAALEVAAIFLKEKAKEKFGHYQDGWNYSTVEMLGIHPSVHKPGYPELAESTKKDRVAKGFSANEPLLRTGELRDSIKHTVFDNSAIVGSTSEIMVYQELGTVGGSHVPPRPILALTAFLEGREAVQLFASVFIKKLFGE